MTAAEVTPSSRPFSEIFGGRTGDGDMATLARSAARAGYAVLPIKPLLKTPLCPFTDLQAKRADKEASFAARDAGRAGWMGVRHPCGIAHATTDPKLAHRWFKRLLLKHPDLNLGVSVAGSKALVADADTQLEMASWLDLWSQKENAEELLGAAPTVRSPGEIGEDGEWKHSAGGHYWFLLPNDVDFGDLAGVTSIPVGTDDDHPAQLKVSGYVLVPPSVREEGAYVMASDACVAPSWLIELVVQHVAGRRTLRAERRDRALDADDQIRLAQSTITWDTILIARGWCDSGKSSRCGCPEWTAPGEHGSTKSATAHNASCGEFDAVDGFIHVWTDNPPGDLLKANTKTFSKIQFVAWHDHDGDMSAAMEELGINRDHGGNPTVVDDAELYDKETAELEAEEAGKKEEEEEAEAEGEPKPEQEPLSGAAKILAELIPACDLDKIPPSVPLVRGLLDRDSLARVIGKSGHGKSFFMIDLAGHVALGRPWHGRPVAQGDVVYMVAEGAAGIRKRVRAWERHHGVKMLGEEGQTVKFLPRPVQVKEDEWISFVAAMGKLKPALIVIDTQARVTSGANENGPEDMGTLVQRADLLKQKTGACVVLVHHKGHQGDHGRGHSSVIAAMDAEIEVDRTDKGKISVRSTKQKDEEDFEDIQLSLISFELETVKEEDGTDRVISSAVLVDREDGAADDVSGVSDPFKAKKPIDEKSPPRDRVAAFLWRTFEGGSGVTPSKLGALVRLSDRGRNGKPMSARTFWRAWADLEQAGAVTANGAKYNLDRAEADRLGLTDAD